MRENIKTHDTKKTYEFPAKDGEKNPHLWEVEMRIASVDGHGNAYFKFSSIAQERIYIERSTLTEHGLIKDFNDKKVEVPPTKTPEDLILELLEIVGVYPTEE